MKQSSTKQSSRNKSIFQKSVAGAFNSKNIKSSASLKSELPPIIKANSAQGPNNKKVKQIVRGIQTKQSPFNEATLQKVESIRLKKINKESDDIDDIDKVEDQSDWQNYQISEVYNNTYNIEQEHSVNVLNETFARQASKNAFERLLKESDIQENLDDEIIDQYIIKAQKVGENETSDNYRQLQNYFNDSDPSIQKSKKKAEQMYYAIERQKEDQKFDVNETDAKEIFNKEFKWPNRNYSLQIKVFHNFKWVLSEIKAYSDNRSFLLFRKFMFFVITVLRIICYQFLSSKFFDLFEIALTLTNILLYLNRSNQNLEQIKMNQQLFFALYLLDVLIHLIGHGLKRYLNSFWNLYDLVILILYYLFINDYGSIPFDISAFRVIRLPVYFGKINNKFNVLLISIKEALKQIVDNFLILILFTTLIALILLYSFNGVLRYRCMQIELGIFSLESYLKSICGFKSCEEGYICSRQLDNIEIPTHFDNIFASYIQTIRTSVLNNWSSTMYMLMKQFNPGVCLFYIFIIFTLNKFYFQLLIAVLKVYYHKTFEFYQSNPMENDFYEDQITIDLKSLQNQGIWKQFKVCRQNYLEGKTQRLEGILCSSSSLNELMSKPPKNCIQNYSNQDQRKFLSARQRNEIHKERQQLQKEFTLDSWIIKFFLPDHQLQSKMKSIITSYENSFDDLKLFFTFKSADYLSLFAEPIFSSLDEFPSIDDILPPTTYRNKTVSRQVKNRNRVFQFYEIKGIDNSIKKNQPEKVKFPLKKSNNKIQVVIKKTIKVKGKEKFQEEVDSSQNQSKYQDQLDNNVCQRFLLEEQGSIQQGQIQIQNHFQFNSKSNQILNHYQGSNISQVISQQNNISFIHRQHKTHKQILSIMEEDCKFVEKIPENYKEIYDLYQIKDAKNLIQNDNWSGNDLISYYRSLPVLTTLNKGWSYLFFSGFSYYLNYFQFQMLQFITLPFVMIVIDSLICINTLVFAFQEYFDKQGSEYLDLLVNIILVTEVLLKAICIKKYLFRLTNVLGGCIILFLIVQDIFFIQKPEYSSLLQILTYFKFFFFFRVIKYNTFAQNMMTISYRTFPSYVNIAILLFFLIFNYAIISLQIFDFPEDPILSMIHYFGNIYQSWIAIYTISSGDDWYGVVILSTTYGAYYLAFIFCISSIFILNYFGFGLAFVIILDGFTAYLDNVQELENTVEGEQNLIVSNQDKDGKDLTVNHQNIKQSFSLADILRSLISPDDLVIYENIECEESLFIFSKANRFRKLCFTVSESQLYKIFIIIIMWGSLLNLIAITYNDDYKLEFWNEFEIIKFICNFFILIDGLIQIITYGVVQSGGYFNSIWVLLDFIYVVCYFCQLFIHHNALGWILFLGYLRPLKVTSQYGFFINERGAIMKSLADILQIFYVVMLFWFIFAIFGMTIYKGKLGYCDELTNFGVGIEECEGEWKIYPQNFDTVLDGMHTLFAISTLDDWAKTLFIYINSNSASHGPVRFNNEWPSFLFFFTFTFIGALFFLQFFAGVLFVNFQQNKSQLLHPDLTLDQELFLNLSEIIMEDTPNYSKPAKKGVRLQAKKILNNKYFTLLTNASLLLNLFTLISLQENASNTYLNILNWFHHFCSFILFIDFIFKLFTHHIRRYFDDGWRQTELIFVIFALIDFILDLRLGLFLRYMRATRDDPYFIWLRLFILNRGLRMTLIIQQFTKIRKLLNVIYFNKMAILRIVGLYVTVISCYSFVGCELFKDIDSGLEMTDQLNFKNFFYGFLAAFKCTTENGWRQIYLDSREYMLENNQTWILTTIFYYSLIFIGVRVLMNLIVCELVQEFEKFYDTSSSCLETYVETIDKFRNLWCKYSEDFQGTKIQTKYLAHFLLELGEPLGTQKGDNIWDAAKYASNFELKKDLEGCLSFRNLLYEVFKSAFRESIFKKSTKAGKLIMKNNDKKIKYRLYNQRAPQYRREVVYEVIDLQSNFNILQEYLYLYMALKAWKSFSKHFFSAAEDAIHTIEYSESDADIKIKSEIYNYKIGEDDENENEQEIHSDSQSEEFEIHPVQRQKKRRPTAEHLRRPTDVYILPYYDQIGKVLPGLQIGEYVLKPTEQKQQNKLKSISVIKKKEQLIKYNEYNKRRDAIDKQIQQRNRYLYGYHDKMVVKPIYDEKTERLMSKLDPMKVPSNYNIVKIGSRLK